MGETGMKCLLTMLVVGLLAGIIESACPSSSVLAPCICTAQLDGLVIQCNAYTTAPDAIKKVLAGITPALYGPIISLTIDTIMGSYFNFVPDNFLADRHIPNVNLLCLSYHDVEYGILAFSVDAFKDSTRKCSLTGNLTIKDCNLRQFNGDALKGCDQLEGIGFINSQVESIVQVPSLVNLKNVTVLYSKIWSHSSQNGLSRIDMNSSSVPKLSYLDLSGNVLPDSNLDMIPDFVNLERLYLEGNNFSVVPKLTKLNNLKQFTMSLNGLPSNLSIYLPSARMTPSLSVILDSSLNGSNFNWEVAALEGDFNNATLKFDISGQFGEFGEDVFLRPLQSLTDDGKIILNPLSGFVCGCSIAWLIRDNRQLLSRVQNGHCTDGRAFESIPVAELECCTNFALVRHIDRQKIEIQHLKATVAEQQLELVQLKQKLSTK